MKLYPKLSACLAAASLGVAVMAIPPAAAAELRCSSNPGGENYCRTDTSRGVDLLYQHSGQPCYQHDTWGYDDRGIWVSNGCTATFRVGEPERDHGDDDTAAKVGLGVLALAILGAAASDQNNNNSNQPQNDYDDYGDDNTLIISCDSSKNKYRHCPVRIQNRVELVRKKSKSACRFNKTWGYDRRGVWVNKGCRAEFAIY